MSFESIFTGKMLGDGYINQNRKRARFCFIHTLRDKGYADYCYDLFASYIPYGIGCTKVEHIIDKRNNNTYSRVYYQSKTSSLIDDLYHIWYVDKRKIVPMKLVDKHFDRQGLAIWYQDDGSYKPKSNRIILSTESFNNEEICYLQNMVERKFGVRSNIDCQNRLDISTRSEVRKFLTLVEPFIHSSMERKSISSNWNDWKTTWDKIDSSNVCISRTTIYLPYDLYQNITGTGYSQLLNNLLDRWLMQVWQQLTEDHSKLYNWIFNHQPVSKGNYPLTPRFKSDIKARLDMLSRVTGFEISELVIIALKEMSM